MLLLGLEVVVAESVEDGDRAVRAAQLLPRRLGVGVTADQAVVVAFSVNDRWNAVALREELVHDEDLVSTRAAGLRRDRRCRCCGRRAQAEGQEQANKQGGGEPFHLHHSFASPGMRQQTPVAVRWAATPWPATS
jgi:hypothetical protein